MNPTGGAVGRRGGGQSDPDEYLLERILSRANLSEAWKRVKANRGAPGVDDMPIDDFMAYAWEHWPGIRSSIFANSYKQAGGDSEGNRGHASPGDSRCP
jgi:RNA-directed DNA polymerase